MSRALGVSASGYYSRLSRPPSKSAVFSQRLRDMIRLAWDSHGGTAGSRTIAADLAAAGMACIGRARVAQSEPNRAWASDITYLPINGGWIYLAVFIDLFSRKVVGWDLSPSLRAESAMKAFHQAVCRRQPGQGLIVHSDRGIQYASKDFRECLSRYGCIQSMSRKGNCWDNAVAEAFFSSLKKRLIYRRKYESLEELRKDIFQYIEVYYKTSETNGQMRIPYEFWL